MLRSISYESWNTFAFHSSTFLFFRVYNFTATANSTSLYASSQLIKWKNCIIRLLRDLLITANLLKNNVIFALTPQLLFRDLIVWLQMLDTVELFYHKFVHAVSLIWRTPSLCSLYKFILTNQSWQGEFFPVLTRYYFCTALNTIFCLYLFLILHLSKVKEGIPWLNLNIIIFTKTNITSHN